MLRKTSHNSQRKVAFAKAKAMVVNMPGEYDINQMREDAVRRAREMQSRARLPSRPPQQRGNPPERHSSAAQREAPREPPAHPNHPPQGQSTQAQSAPERNGLLETLFQDKERTVLLALLLLLSEDDSHHDLMFALMFLLM